MKMQYHNIGGVKKAVCTAEQKIAYNLARGKILWSYEEIGKAFPAYYL